jgi:hypothetical protein
VPDEQKAIERLTVARGDEMKPPDVFGIVVRTLGLLLVLGVAPCLLLAILSLALGGPYNVAELLIFGLPTLVVGLWLLRGAPLLVSFAYPDAFRKTRRTAPSQAAHRDAAIGPIGQT